MEFIGIIVGIFGITFGSFLNVLIDRLPNGEDVVRGRSHCDHCGRTLSWYELIPFVSWVVQGGKSRCCHKRISMQYPLIEVLTGIGFVYLYYVSSSPLLFVSSVLLFCPFVVVCITDLKTETIPTVMLYAIAVGVLVRWYALGVMHLLFPSYIFPALIGAGFFFLLWLFSKGKAMGDGDIFLAFLIGCITGYPNIIIAFYAAFLTGAIVGVILILRRTRTMKSHISFGPFLIIGMGIALMWSVPILHFWNTLW